jgi:hypothetical protein
MASYSQNELASQLFSQLQSRKTCSLLFWRLFSLLCFLADLSLSPKLLPFFPSSARLHGSESPTRGQAWKPYRWVPCPISSLTLEDGLPTTSLTGNSFLGQRTVEKLHPVGTGLVRVISTILGFPHHLSHSIHGLSWKTPPFQQLCNTYPISINNKKFIH